VENTKKVSEKEYQVAGKQTQNLPEANSFQQVGLKKIRGGLLLAIGYLLSPLCWWNDLFFNLPIAYGFGYICSWLSPDLLFPGTIVGYWLSNIAGILLMQFGAVDVFADKPKQKNLKKELLTGLVSSTAFTIVVVALIHFKILDTPDIFSGESVNLNSLLSMIPRSPYL
jgi:hypothetical protein